MVAPVVSAVYNQHNSLVDALNARTASLHIYPRSRRKQNAMMFAQINRYGLVAPLIIYLESPKYHGKGKDYVRSYNLQKARHVNLAQVKAQLCRKWTQLAISHWGSNKLKILSKFKLQYTQDPHVAHYLVPTGKGKHRQRRLCVICGPKKNNPHNTNMANCKTFRGYQLGYLFLCFFVNYVLVLVNVEVIHIGGVKVVLPVMISHFFVMKNVQPTNIAFSNTVLINICGIYILMFLKQQNIFFNQGVRFCIYVL